MIDKSTVKGTRSTHQPGHGEEQTSRSVKTGTVTHTHTDHVVKAG